MPLFGELWGFPRSACLCDHHAALIRPHCAAAQKLMTIDHRNPSPEKMHNLRWKSKLTRRGYSRHGGRGGAVDRSALKLIATDISAWLLRVRALSTVSDVLVPWWRGARSSCNV